MTAAIPVPQSPARSAEELLHAARALERAASIPAAIAAYQGAIAAAQGAGDTPVLAEALRRLAVLRHHRNESDAARRLCRRSHAVAQAGGWDVLAAEALNTLGGIDLETDAVADARQNFLSALELGAQNLELRARAEQNLGILAAIQGDVEEAMARYERSLAAYRGAHDQHGCAIAYHNLGMASADGEQFDAAERYFQQSFDIALQVQDARLQGLCLVNHAKVHVARGRYEAARSNVETALGLFDRVGMSGAKADAYRVLGMLYRETGRPALAESRLRSAIELAVSAGSLLNEAEASRELARLYQAMGRNQEALGLLHAAHSLFGRLDARAHAVHVGRKMAELEETYLAVVREWGRSIESSDTYTFGHCERVARHSDAVALALGLDPHARTTVRLGAYLHDLGKVRVPHEILSKPGALTGEEFAVIKMHPGWGIELVENIAFPWDIRPIIRWHHERYDGSGYPDGLRGYEVPLSAQIVGIVDVYDALTTTRPYRRPHPPAAALAEIERCRAWWSANVYGAFVTSLETYSAGT